jgi:hypothetical protein
MIKVIHYRIKCFSLRLYMCHYSAMNMWLESKHEYLVTADGLDDAYAQAKEARIALIEAYQNSQSPFAPYLGAMQLGTFEIGTLLEGRRHPEAGFAEIFMWKVDYPGSMDGYFEEARGKYVPL